MDASQYKDYVLGLLFIKYVSDKYAGQPYAPITTPPGARLPRQSLKKSKATFQLCRRRTFQLRSYNRCWRPIEMSLCSPNRNVSIPRSRRAVGMWESPFSLAISKDCGKRGGQFYRPVFHAFQQSGISIAIHRPINFGRSFRENVARSKIDPLTTALSRELGIAVLGQ